jgi:hypothetical protein
MSHTRIFVIFVVLFIFLTVFAMAGSGPKSGNASIRSAKSSHIVPVNKTNKGSLILAGRP